MRRKNRRGFTAIELIVVVIIIGILAAAGLGKYRNFTNTARKNACIANQEQITAAIRLAENDLGPLASSSVMRLHVDGTIDSTACTVAGNSSASPYGIWLGNVPSGWSATNVTNATVLGKAGDMKLFRCPEDTNNQDPSYTRISSLLQNASGVYTASTDTCTYTFAKSVASTFARAASFTPAIPNATADPLEGFNWLRNSVEWQNTSFTFCRRWGLRDSTATGLSPAGLNGVAADVNYVPGLQERRLAHSSFAPTQ